MINPPPEYIPEGLTIIFEAPQRWGKTLGMVIWAVDALQAGRNIFSTIQLAFPHEPLEFTHLRLEGGRSMFWNGWICIDELNFFFDGRRSMSGNNLEFAKFLLQQKKQGCTITGTTHDLESLDVRFRRNYDFLITPRVYPRYPSKPESITMDIENGPLQADFFKTIKLDCRPFLGLYDTFAVYDPFKEASVSPTKRGRRLTLKDE